MAEIPAAPVVTVVEHEADCTVDRWGPWLEDDGVALDVVRPYAGDVVPAVGDVVALLVLGGDMGAYEDHRAPWLPAVRTLLRDAVVAGTPTLGICLGAQLLAVATGGRVERGSRGSERGVVDVGWTGAAATDPFVSGLSSPFPTPSMHDDAVVALPPGAVLLGGTSQYAHQAFRVGARAWGLQFHPEARPESLLGWAAAMPAAEREAIAGQLHARDAEVAPATRSLAQRFAAVVRAGTPSETPLRAASGD